MAASSQHFRLLDLPRELRDRCYHFALLDSCITFSEHHVRFHTHYLRPKSRAFPRRNRLLSMHWLLASKQILAETVEQFYRHSTCTSIGQPSAHSDHRAAIFTFSRIQRLDLSIHIGFRREDVEGQPIVSVVPNIQNLSSFIAKKETFLPQLQEVGLRLFIHSLDIPRCLRYLRPGKKTDIDFAALEALGTAISRVKINVWHPPIPENHYQNGRHIVERIKDELVRVANVMVGREGGAEGKEVGWREMREGKISNWNVDLKCGIAA